MGWPHPAPAPRAYIYRYIRVFPPEACTRVRVCSHTALPAAEAGGTRQILRSPALCKEPPPSHPAHHIPSSRAVFHRYCYFSPSLISAGRIHEFKLLGSAKGLPSMLPKAPVLTPARGEPSLPVQPQPGANPTIRSTENTLMKTCSAPCVEVICPTMQKARGGTAPVPSLVPPIPGLSSRQLPLQRMGFRAGRAALLVKYLQQSRKNKCLLFASVQPDSAVASRAAARLNPAEEERRPFGGSPPALQTPAIHL